MDESPDDSASDREALGAVIDWEPRLKHLKLTTGTIVWTAPAGGPFDGGMQEMAEFAGVPPAELSGEGWAAFVHPAERDEALFLSRQAKFMRTPATLVCRFRGRDGVYRHMTVRAVPVFDDAGEIREWVGVASDDTERLAAEAAYRERTQLLQVVLEGAPVILFALDAGGRFSACEGRLLHEAPGGPFELVGQSIFECIARAPENQAAVRKALAGEAAIWEGAIDGLRLVAHLLPVFDDAGKPDGAVGVAVDYTPLRETEEALRQSQEHYRTLAEASPDQIFSIDRDRRVKYVNARAAQSRERAPAELVGRTLGELFDAKTAARMAANLESGFASGDTREVEGSWNCPRGTAYFRTWLVPVKDEEGTVSEIFGIARDITEHRQAEQEIRRLNEELEQRVVSRTTELEAVTKELEAFAYSASHDLRAPLRTIDGFSAMVLEDAAGRLSADDVAHLQRVRAAAQRMGQLIDEILGLSRLTRTDMNRGTVDLSAMARAVCEELVEESPKRLVEVTVEPGIVVDADPELLRVILRNLLDNAWKFTSRHARAKISVGAGAQHGQQVIYVRDDGAGFDPRHAEHLFGAFQRLHAKDEFEGDGIGLAIVQRLVNRHGGAVWATGEVERGATFSFTLSSASRATRTQRVR